MDKAVIDAIRNKMPFEKKEQLPDSMTDSDIAREYKGTYTTSLVNALLWEGQDEEALASAYRALPKVLNYLIAEKRKQPKLDPQGMIIGGADQAWYYRQDMRDVFEATPGMLAWLKRTKQRLPR